MNSAALTQVSTVVFLQQLTFHMTAEREFSLGCVSGFEMNHTLLQNDKSARVTVSIMLSDTWKYNLGPSVPKTTLWQSELPPKDYNAAVAASWDDPLELSANLLRNMNHSQNMLIYSPGLKIFFFLYIYILYQKEFFNSSHFLGCSWNQPKMLRCCVFWIIKIKTECVHFELPQFFLVSPVPTCLKCAAGIKSRGKTLIKLALCCFQLSTCQRGLGNYNFLCYLCLCTATFGGNLGCALFWKVFVISFYRIQCMFSILPRWSFERYWWMCVFLSRIECMYK